MSQSRRQFSPSLRIPALILCGTFSLTQAAPAWALRQREPERGTPALTGLEEQILAGARAEAPDPLALLPALGEVAIARFRVGAATPPRAGGSASPEIQSTETLIAQAEASGWLSISGVSGPLGDPSTTVFLNEQAKFHWPTLQFLIRVPTPAVRQWMTKSTRELADGIRGNNTDAAAAAILKQCAFCATVSRGSSERYFDVLLGDPIALTSLADVIGTLENTGIAKTLDSSVPVYLLDETKLTDQSVTFVKIAAGRREPATVNLNPQERSQVAAYVAARQRVDESRPKSVSARTLEEERAAKRAVAAWHQVQEQLRQERQQLFGRLAVATFGADAVFRNTVFDTYAGGWRDLSQHLRRSWELKRFDQMVHVFRDPARRTELLRIAGQLEHWIEQEEATIERRLTEVESIEDQEMIYRSLTAMKDLAWNLRHDVVENLGKMAALGRLRLGDRQTPLEVLRYLWDMTLLFNAMDFRMEARGRDSLGVSPMAKFANQAAYEAYLASLDTATRAAFQRRQQIPNLEDGRVIVRPGFDADGHHDPQRPVVVTLVYKVTQVVGALGDNGAAIRAKMIDDLAFQRLFRQPLQSLEFLIHTRWASAGRISGPNTHPVDNTGNYLLGPHLPAAEYGAIPLGPGTFQMVARFQGRMPHYGQSGFVLAILNGDIDNYNEERLRRTGYFPNLTEDYLRWAGPWQKRFVSPDVTTDTKLIPLRVEHYLLQGYDLQEAIRRAARDFDGSFAIQVMSDLEPGKRYLVMNGEGQGLYVGVSPEGYQVASETYGFVDVTQRFLRVRPGWVVMIDDTLPPTPDDPLRGLVVTDLHGDRILLTAEDLDTTPQTARDTYLDSTKYEHYYAKEIGEAAAMFRATVGQRVSVRQEGDRKVAVVKLDESEFAEKISELLATGRYRKACFFGMGTAKVAADVAARALHGYLEQSTGRLPASVTVGVLRDEEEPKVETGDPFEPLNRLATESVFGPELQAFGLKDVMDDTLIIAVSQSGKSSDTNVPLQKAIDAGATVLGIINTRDSDAAFKIRGAKDRHGNPVPGGVMHTGTGRDIEVALASTKAHYAQVAAGVIDAMKIASALGVPNEVFVEDIEELHRLPAKMRAFEQAVTQSRGQHPLIQAADFWPLRKPSWDVVSLGPGMAAAYEAMVKLGELVHTSMNVSVFAETKHEHYSSEGMYLMLLANLQGGDGFLDQNAESELDKMLSHNIAPIVVTHEGDERFQGKKVSDVDARGRRFDRPLDIIYVPRTSERFAHIFLTMASHLLAYYIARRIDTYAKDVLAGLRAVAEKRQALKRDNFSDEQIIRDRLFRQLVEQRFGETLRLARTGMFNKALRLDEMITFAELLSFAIGDVDLSRTEFYLGESLTATQVLDAFERSGQQVASRLRHPIDAVPHQAKYVTVGVKAQDDRPGNVQKIVEALRDRAGWPAVVDPQTLLELAHGYQRYRQTGHPWVDVIPDPSAPLERSLVLTVADDVPGVLAGSVLVMASEHINLGSAKSGAVDDGAGTVAVIVENVNRPVTALRALKIAEKVRGHFTELASDEERMVSQLAYAKRSFSEDDFTTFRALLQRYQTQGGLVFDVRQVEFEGVPHTVVKALFPYERPRGVRPPLLQIPTTVETVSETLGRKILVADLFVRGFRIPPENHTEIQMIHFLYPMPLADLRTDPQLRTLVEEQGLRRVLAPFIKSSTGLGESTPVEPAARAAEAMRTAYETYRQLDATLRSRPWGLPLVERIGEILALVNDRQFASARLALLEMHGQRRLVVLAGNADSAVIQQMYQVLDTALAAITPLAGAGLEETATVTRSAAPAREAIPLMPMTATAVEVNPGRPTIIFRDFVGELKALAAAPATVPAGVGAIAGPGLVDGVSGLAHGVVLRQQLGVPVVFLVASEAQKAQFLNTEFFDPDDVLVVSGHVAADAERAARQLAAKYNVGVAGRIYLGVEGQPAAPSLEALLAQWGVDLTAYPASLLRYRIGKASEYFA